MQSYCLVADRAGSRFLSDLQRNPTRIDERSFRTLLEAIRATAPLHAGREFLPRNAVTSLWAVCSMARQWALDPDGVLRRTGIVRPRDLVFLAGWIDTLEYEVALAWGAASPTPPWRTPHVPVQTQEGATYAALRAERSRAARARRALRGTSGMTPAEVETRILRHADSEREGLLNHLRSGLVLESDFDQLVEAFHAGDEEVPRRPTIPRTVAVAAWEVIRLTRLEAVHPQGGLRHAGIITAADAVRLAVLVDDLEREGAISMFAP